MNIFIPENSKLLNNFIEYAIQDSVALLNALTKAQKLYFKEYKVDLADTLSTPSLSLKIFRSKFLNKDIPI